MSNVVAMIAPVSPFRGGIAQHSTMLANALAGICDLRLFSYHRLYPRLLYPGEEQKDETTRLANNRKPAFILDSLDPRSWMKVARQIVESGAEVVVIPWWTFFLAPCYVAMTRLLKRKGVRIVFICHNYSDHESAWWKRRLSRFVLRSGDAFVMHAEAVRRDLESDLGERPCLVAPMPIYDDYPEPTQVRERRAELELLFFGFVRKYKGLDILLRAAAALERRDWFLSVVGECWSDADEYRALARDLGIADRVEFVFKYVAEVEAADAIARADVLVLPYRSATGSAVIPLAYHYNKPVIVTPVGGLPEVVEHGRTGFILPSVLEEDLTEFLSQLDREDCIRMAAGIVDWKRVNNWNRLATAVLTLASARSAKGLIT